MHQNQKKLQNKKNFIFFVLTQKDYTFIEQFAIPENNTPTPLPPALVKISN